MLLPNPIRRWVLLLSGLGLGAGCEAGPTWEAAEMAMCRKQQELFRLHLARRPSAEGRPLEHHCQVYAENDQPDEHVECCEDLARSIHEQMDLLRGFEMGVSAIRQSRGDGRRIEDTAFPVQAFDSPDSFHSARRLCENGEWQELDEGLEQGFAAFQEFEEERMDACVARGYTLFEVEIEGTGESH